MVLGESLRSQGSAIAQRLRKAGRRVDLVLEAKKMKWVFKVRVPVCACCCICPTSASCTPGTGTSSLQASSACIPLLVRLCTALGCHLLICAILSCSKQSAVGLSA